MKSRIAFALGAAGLLTAAPLFAGLATAEPQQGSSENPTEQRVSEFLQQNPEAQRVGDNEIKLRDGLNLRLATAPHQQQVCGEGHLCAYNDVNFEGDVLDFYECSESPVGFPIEWTNQLKSFQNAQFEGTVATFHNWNAETGEWEEVGNSTAPDENPEVGAPLNQTDGIKAC